MDMQYTSNPGLKNMDLPFEWKGTPVDSRGRFVNHELVHNHSFLEFLKWRLQENPQGEEKKNERWAPEIIPEDHFLSSGEDCIVWLGHASFFIRLAGQTLLIDPVFFNIPVIRRRTPLPVDPLKFKGLDYILVSHNHRDHCDEKSLRLLAAGNQQATYLTGLKLDKLIRKFTGSSKIQAAGWYQQYDTASAINVFYLPSRHWAKRGLTDFNEELWGAFVIQGAGKTIYFGGDSGYGGHFKDVARIFPQIDYCMIGVGAYKPEFFMAQSHSSPQDAVKAANDLNARVFIPMHYGTFDLADEPMGEPLRILAQLEAAHKINPELKVLKIGEELLLNQ